MRLNNFIKWTVQKRPHWRESPKEAIVICTVFAMTGSTTMFCVRPVLNSLGIKGSMTEGPNSYRVLSLLTISPIYSVLLITFGTLAGRHLFFAGMGKKILGRFVPGSYKEKILCEPAKSAKGIIKPPK